METVRQPEYRIEDSPLHRDIEDALKETLAKADDHGIPLYLMGGISASLLAREAWPGATRPLSRDLDFLVPDSPDVIATLEKTYGGRFIRNTKKAVFQSYKLQSKAANGVELDFIAESNVVHPDTCFSMHLGELAKTHASTERFLGTEVRTLPPEMVVLQKLAAGRGTDLGKFDLTDAEAILASGRVNTDLASQIVQEYVLSAEWPGLQSRLLSSLNRLAPTPGVRGLQEAITALPIAQCRRTAAHDLRQALRIMS